MGGQFGDKTVIKTETITYVNNCHTLNEDAWPVEQNSLEVCSENSDVEIGEGRGFQLSFQ